MAVNILTNTISSQNQVTLPKALREALDLEPGDVVSWVIEQGKAVLVPLNRQKTDPVEELMGSAKKVYKKYGGAKGVIEQNRQDWED